VVVSEVVGIKDGRSLPQTALVQLADGWVNFIRSLVTLASSLVVITVNGVELVTDVVHVFANALVTFAWLLIPVFNNQIRLL